MLPVVEADKYDFTCKQLSVPVFILLKAPPFGSLKESKNNGRKLDINNDVVSSPAKQRPTTKKLKLQERLA